MISLKHSVQHYKIKQISHILKNGPILQDFIQNSLITEHQKRKTPINKTSKSTTKMNNNKINSIPIYKQAICYSFSQQFKQSKQATSNNIKASHSSLGTLLQETKQHYFLVNLFESFHNQSLNLNKSFQSDPEFIPDEKFTQILSSLSTLSQNINLFLLQLQIQQISEIDKLKWTSESWSGKLKQHRENILIEIEERKLFYKRLQNFLNNVTRQLQALFYKQNPTHSKNTTTNKNVSQIKNQSKLVQGDYFKHNFLTQNYQEIYDRVSQSKEDYLLKSRKLKSFSLLKTNEYQSNYALKLRFIIRILSHIKQAYQFFLINQSKKHTLKSIQETILPLNKFLSQTIISADQYDNLIQVYFNQFSQESIKNFMFMSVGYHSPQISELSKQLVDVKIRETIFDYDIDSLCSLYMVRQNEWLFNSQSGEDFEQSIIQNRDQNHNDKNYRSIVQPQSKRLYNYQTNKEIVLKYAKVILQQFHKLKKQSRNLQNYSINPSQNASMLKNEQNSQIDNYSPQKVSFNQLFPHHFFNITDVISLQSLIQQHIIPLMVNPYIAYQNLQMKRQKSLQKSKNQQQIQLIQSEFFEDVLSLLKDQDENMYFLSRFNQWNISMIVHIQKFLAFFIGKQSKTLKNQVQLLLKEQNIITELQTPFSIIFFRLINILYNATNHINPIYIEDFIKTMDLMTIQFSQLIDTEICKQMSLSPARLFELYDKILLKMIDLQKNTQNVISSSFLRFRVLSTFLETQLINRIEFFQLLLNEKTIRYLKYNDQNLQSNPIISFILHAGGLQKCLRIYSDFYAYEKNSFFQLHENHINFKKFSQLLLSFQNNFNAVLQSIQSFQNSQIQDPKVKKTKSNHNINLKKQSFAEKLQFYQQNDLIHRFQYTDQEIYMNWLDKASFTKIIEKKGNQNRINKENKLQGTFRSVKDLNNPLKILNILSQNINFLSYTMNLSYFGYLKYIIGQMHSFQKFQFSWNYPFVADIAIGKSIMKDNKLQNHILYIQTLPTSGIQGRGRFFKEQTSLKRNFMNFIHFDKSKRSQLKLYPVETKKHFYGVRNHNKSMIQLRISIDKGQQLLNTVKQWLQDKFEIIEKTKNNRYDPQNFK